MALSSRRTSASPRDCYSYLREFKGGYKMHILRRLFVVPIANNNKGKTTMIRELVAQGMGAQFDTLQKGRRKLISPGGRPIDAYVFNRSFQEVERKHYSNVEAALDGNDPHWARRDLVIMSSHVTGGSKEHISRDIDQMIAAAHATGFDAVCAQVLLGNETAAVRKQRRSLLLKPWDERWTIPNPHLEDDPEGQLSALGRDLWTFICRTMVPLA